MPLFLQGRFDHVDRAPKETKELDESKSKKGLTEIYEESVQKKTGFVPNAEEDKLEKEISTRMKELQFLLSQFSYKPKPIIEDMSIQTNVPALAMEEIAPVAVSDAAMLAPEEVFAGKGDIKEEVELTREERKQRRANKKRKFKATATKKMGSTPLDFTMLNPSDGTSIKFVFKKNKRYPHGRRRPLVRKILSHDKDNYEWGSGSRNAIEGGNQGFMGPQMHNRFKNAGKPQIPKKIKMPDLESLCLRCGPARHWVRDCKTPWVPKVKVQANHITTDITSITMKLTVSDVFGDTDADMDQHTE
ncbi:hypothetical protein GIB67_017671 [Kingdonia uniflora]|uniref:Uncharacterized protein n=1 Tax=Kingdonia uniflora TaxID=39325 RepID=A0A7J7NAB6_9MAGN|nr:hypothetical protein GIB67_017671 [Kingdonia uniflora]